MKELIQKLETLDSQLFALQYSQMMIHWDAATAAPLKSVEGRAHALVHMDKFFYDTFITEENLSMLEILYNSIDELDEISKSKFLYYKEMYDKMSCVPVDEYAAYSGVCANASQAWQEAKQKNDYSIFAPHLVKVIDFQKKYVNYRNLGGHPYSTILNEFERGLTVEEADKLFSQLRNSIVPLVKKIKEKNKLMPSPFENKVFPIEHQRKISNYFVDALCLDPDATVISESIHPISIGLAPGDVRLTTYYSDNKPLKSIFGIIHESGHALYNQNIGSDLGYSLLASGSSVGIHESQSRLYENNIGRSKAFWEVHFPMIQETFPELLKDVTAHDCYMAINKSEPSLIRAEADELTYSLHVMIRYEIEKRLMEDTVTVQELPSLWNDLYEEYLGLRPSNDAEGILQVIHWSQGIFGYFCSYAFGNAYAAQLQHAMNKEFNFEDTIRDNNLHKIKNWLTDKIHKFGSTKSPSELIELATGEPFNPQYYIDYLTNKYTALYDL